MSFVGTPLGQGRRLDHGKFVGKPTSSSSSYSYTAPALGARSPPTRDFSERPGGPKTITSPPKPEKWAVKDTSVNIATAFTQAATDMTTTSYNHNNAWASTSRAIPVPRSTSVEYEAAAPQTANRRLPAPPDKFTRPSTRNPRHVPDSEGEDDTPKNPFEQGLSFARNALSTAAFYVRQRSHDPDDQHPHPNGSPNGHESSYDYAAEEHAFQAQKRSAAALKRNRMSVDNKAYKPSQESEDDQSEWSDDGKTRRRRRKFKKGPAGGPLSSLPVVTADKKRRKKSKGNPLDPDEDDSGSDPNTQRDTSILSNFLPSRQISNVPQDLSQNDFDDSIVSAEQGLQSIPEVDEEHLLPNHTSLIERQEQRRKLSPPPIPRRAPSTRPRSRSRTPGPHSHLSQFSVGGLLGSIVHLAAKLVMWFFSGFLALLSGVAFWFGQVFGATFDLLWRRPSAWARGTASLTRYLLPAVVLVCAWYVLRDVSLGSYVPSLSFPTSRLPRYHAPDVPPADLAEFAERLLRIESAISGLSRDAERTIVKTENGIKSYYDLQGRLASLEGRISSEARQVHDSEAKARDAFGRSISGVKQEVEVLQSQLNAQRKQIEKDREGKVGTDDEEARARLKILEERIGGVEGGVKDALDQLAKKPQAPPPSSSPATSPAWWNKLASNIGVIKSADGQDITILISQLVHSAVSTLSKDVVAKPDFALWSGGARVIPSLTSPTLELRPKGFARQIYDLFSGAAYPLGRPPVTALHHELHNGHCWPFAGKEGQLGVMLAAPTVVVEEVTIDHVAKEVAFDVRSAPREMEVWGMVEGTKNIERVRAWRESGGAASYDGGVVYPPKLSRQPEYLRLANFTYDVDAPDHVQTFAIDSEIRALDLDFGIVVLRVLSNWGMESFTCVYRFRVHGKLVDGSVSSREGVTSGVDVEEQESS